MSEDKRPAPRPRKHPALWQMYLMWNELVEMRKRHLLRISSIEKGKSNLDRMEEKNFIEAMALDQQIRNHEGAMIDEGYTVGPVWEWLGTIRGLKAGQLRAALVAQIDDIGRFATVSKLWRFTGYAVIDGKIDRCQKGVKSPYNRRLKSILFLIADQFVRQQTPLYVDIYYVERERQYRLHPTPICKKCGSIGVQKGQSWKCTGCSSSGRGLDFTPDHIRYRCKRKMIKIFLQHLWLEWRESEGLPISQPYVQAIMGHTNIVQPSAA